MTKKAQVGVNSDILRGERFAEICEERWPGESRAAIAARFGVSEGSVRNWEKGAKIHTDALKDLCIEGVDIAYLLTGIRSSTNWRRHYNEVAEETAQERGWAKRIMDVVRASGARFSDIDAAMNVEDGWVNHVTEGNVELIREEEVVALCDTVFPKNREYILEGVGNVVPEPLPEQKHFAGPSNLPRLLALLAAIHMETSGQPRERAAFESVLRASIVLIAKSELLPVSHPVYEYLKLDSYFA